MYFSSVQTHNALRFNPFSLRFCALHCSPARSWCQRGCGWSWTLTAGRRPLGDSRGALTSCQQREPSFSPHTASFSKAPPMINWVNVLANHYFKFNTYKKGHFLLLSHLITNYFHHLSLPTLMLPLFCQLSKICTLCNLQLVVCVSKMLYDAMLQSV